MLKTLKILVLALLLANLFGGCWYPTKDKTEQANRGGGGDEDPDNRRGRAA